jgi:endonuclease/exonuclease/phosphatase (EEP) superfamily protein YafD
MVYARRFAVAAVAIAVIGVVAAVLLPLIPVWPFALFEHFRFQYLWAGVVFVAACGALRMCGWFDAALIATLIHALWVLPDLSRSRRVLPAGTPLRVLVINVHTSSSGFAQVRALIDDTKPDLIGLVEVDARWLAELAPSLAGYPNHIEDPRDDNFGVALYSIRPMIGSAEKVGSQLPTIFATVDTAGAPVGVVLTHPIPPVSGAALDDEVAQLEAIATRVRSVKEPVIVMGDLNATPWSRPFRDFVAATGLCDSRAGFGLQASFPAASAVLRIPIDHVLISCSLGVRSRVIERDVGSDHLPVLVDLVVPRR